jgi:hypothetical protein
MHASPTVADGKVFIPADASNYYCVNATSGEVIWTIEDKTSQYTTGTILYAEGKLYMADELFWFGCYDATNGSLLWRTYLAREIFGSATYSVGKVYIGMDNRVLFVLNAETGEKLSWYDGFESNWVWSAPALYNRNLYIGSIDGNIYCFEEDIPLISTEMMASMSKSQVDKDLSESVTVSGSVSPTDGSISPIYASIPVKVTFTKPDGTNVDVATTTTAGGVFECSYTPDVVGDWTATAWWEGDETHTFAFTEDMTLKVVGEEEPTNGNGNGNGTEPPPEEGIPTEYIYAAVAVIAIIIAAVSIYLLRRRRT